MPEVSKTPPTCKVRIIFSYLGAFSVNLNVFHLTPAKDRHLTCVAGLTPVLRSLSQNTVILTILGAGLLLPPATPTLYSRSLAAFTVTLEPGLLAGNLSL